MNASITVNLYRMKYPASLAITARRFFFLSFSSVISAASFALGDAERARAEALLDGLGLGELTCGYTCDFPDLFTVALGVCDPAEGPQNYVGTLVCALEYDEADITLTDPVYVPDP